MAVTLLRVLVLGVIAAAADDVPITWWGSSRVFLPCVVPNPEKIVVRRPPPLLDDDDQTKPQNKSKPYIWRKDKEELWSKITKNGTLEVSKKKDGSTEGVYQCTVRHQAGLVLGYPVRLKFAYLNKQFTVRPEDVTVNAGQPVLLNCEISSGPAANITWMKNGEPLPQDKRYHLLKNQLLILDTTFEDAGFYRCKASNPQANKTRTSHGGRVQVVESKDTDLAFLPLQQEQNIAVPRGDDVLLACPIAGWPRPKFLWQFTAPGERTAEFEDVDEIFTIQQVDLDSEGVYSCTVEGRSDLSKSFTISITEPVNITIPPSSKTISLANTVRFNCTATGRPAPTITWYKDGVPLLLENRIMVRTSVNGERMELLIRYVISEDSGVYQCVASNSISSASAWASLNVTGAAAAPPQGVMCAPVGLHNISVRWNNMSDVIAFTVHMTAPGYTSLPTRPVLVTEDTVFVKEPFVPYSFQVRAYLASKENSKSVVSEMSASVTCYGQGVPVKLVRSGDDVTVSWRQFADQNPGVKEWILQYKNGDNSQVTNITLGPEAYKYTVKGASPDSLQVRLLGTKQLPWLHQNLTLVPWTSTNTAHNFNDEIKAIPESVTVTDVGPNHFAITWQCKEAEKYPEVSYLVCTTDKDEKQDCLESYTNSAYVGNLTQNSEYEVRVQVLVPSINLKGKFTQPIYISTQSKGPQKFKDLTYKLVNSTTLRVSWNSNPDKYIIYYSNDLTQVPVNQWPYVETVGNTVLLTGVDLTRDLYVMVTGYEPLGRSPILIVPPQVTVSTTEEDEDQVQYSYTSNGILLSWSSTKPRVVKYSQNLTHFLENWIVVNSTGNTVELTNLSPSLDTFVAVSDTNVLTVPPQPHVDNPPQLLYICIGIVGGLLILCFVAFTTIFIWRRRKNARSPSRARRRHESPGQDNIEENAEMKSVGGRLANGGSSKDAGEPLLNGHVNITENPNPTKTPNGRMRRGHLYEASFDVARYDDPDTTLETVLDADTSANSFSFLDTSRIPDYDVTRSPPLTTNDSYNKLPDGNMNSELRSTSQIDDGKILPTLQPNG